MSPEKLVLTLSAILKDFAPDHDRQSETGFSPASANAPTSEKQTKPVSPEQMETLQPHSLFLAFVKFLRFPYHGRGEKVAWTIHMLFKGLPFSISHRKFGLSIEGPHEPSGSPDFYQQMLNRLVHAVRIVDALVKPFSEEQIAKGNVTIENKLYFHRARYEYFCEQSERRFSTAAKWETKPVNIKPPRKLLTQVFAAKTRAMELRRHGNYLATAALDAYFSYIEHLLILLLPFSGFEADKDNLLKFLNMLWGDKWKRVFDSKKNSEANRVYETLVKIKRKFRNPLAHGGFDSEGEGVWIQIMSLGAVPASMSRFGESIHSALNPIDEQAFTEIRTAFDKSDHFFKTGALQLGYKCVSAGIDVSFAAESISKYKEIVESGDVQGFVEAELAGMDNATNMDW